MKSGMSPRLYLPFADGRYTVTARMRPLGAEPHFQVDEQYLDFIQAKQASRRAHRDRYYRRANPSLALECALLAFALPTLAADAPQVFRADGDTLENLALGLRLRFDPETACVIEASDPEYVGMAAIEALALQTQEDWALLAREGDSDRTVALHVSFPSHWRPEDKIDRSFVEVHRPVPGVDALLKAAPSIVGMMVDKGPWERFTWTLPRSSALDEHLDALPARGPIPSVEAVGRSAWLRVERQVTHGFPAAEGALFTIRLHIVPLEEAVADPAMARALASAVRSKTPDSVAYKQLQDWQEPLLAYLDGRGAE
ncbi:MAG: hypothetical protein JWM80_6678 [Cyanobacteria bacterium RYN_339]|nr:hypothetical protein [Cyanobacteria bacterium RYN_339]